MKTIVLMGISCLMLACVYGVMIKKSEVSNLLSLNKANNTVSSFGSDMNKAAPAIDSAENKTSTSKTLDDSHWIYDPLFEKAAGSELITDIEVDLAAPQQKDNPEAIKREAPEQEHATQPEVKKLILDLGNDSTPVKKDLVEVI
ncbi:hypothetical protein [Niastella sp. OAS944]|uniref:hypothetical protein n=1 Tax=Niastella sp. OAS944 TaxID=2664089 RepID=UPI003483BD0B|nr:hypothetical protein [Chitinophagaceae bacterium OAS944]